jgi:hypothetical protein
MPTPVSPLPSAFTLSAVQTGKQVSSAHLLRLASECSFLGGYNLQSIVCAEILPRNTARVNLNTLTPWNIPFTYFRSPGAQVVCVIVTLTTGYSATGKVKVTVNLPSGATWVVHNGLDGSVTRNWPPGGRVAVDEIVGFIDVTGLTAGAQSNFSIQTDLVTTTGVSSGVARARAFEVPLSASDVSADPTEPLLEQASTLYPNRLIDGGSSSPRGLARLAYLMDKYRSGFRPHIQLCGVESANNAATATNPHWHRESTADGVIEWQYNTTGVHDIGTRFCVRNLYGVGVGALSHPYTLCVRYKTNANVNDAQLTINAVAQGGGATTISTVCALPKTNNVWTWATFTPSIPGDGVGGLVKVNYTAKGGNAGGESVQFSCLALIDTQP